MIDGRSPSDASHALLREMRKEPRRKATVAAARPSASA